MCLKVPASKPLGSVAGKSYFRKAGVEHDVLNETAAEIVFLEVELKP